MNTDDLIQKAMGGAGTMIGGQDLFILEGNARTNEFRILTADKVLGNNLVAFANEISTEYMFLGMFTSSEAAEETVEAIRTLVRDEKGNRLT
jgi:hypothetical protein